MSPFFKLWFWRSLPIIAVHYLLILLIWGHDAPPTTQALLLPAIWGNAAATWQDLTFEIPKFTDLFIGPFLLLWYMVNYKHLILTSKLLKVILLTGGSTVVLFQGLYIGMACFIFTGYMLAKSSKFSTAVIQLAFLGYGLLFVMWAFTPISFGFIGWCYAFLSLTWGFGCVFLFKLGRATKP